MAVQNTASESVDVLNKGTGDVVTQYATNSDRAVNLTQSSIVRINASPQTVNFYERQGNDLIVHMKDGTTARYRNFFNVDADGQHSELVFEDALGVHHAVFPFAAEAGPATAEAIVPTYVDTSLSSLMGNDGISGMAVLGGIAAVAGIAGIAIAASSGGGGHHDNNNGGGDNGSGGNTGGGNTGGGDNGSGGNTGGGNTSGGNTGGGDNGSGGNTGGGNTGGGNTGGGTNPGTTPPSTITANPLTVDDIINKAESLASQLLTGTTEAINAGSKIIFTLGGQSWSTIVGKDGSWSTSVPDSILNVLSQGDNSIHMTMVDSASRTVTKDMTFTVDTVAPMLELTRSRQTILLMPRSLPATKSCAATPARLMSDKP